MIKGGRSYKVGLVAKVGREDGEVVGSTPPLTFGRYKVVLKGLERSVGEVMG